MAVTPARWGYYKLRAWAVLDGKTIDVAGFQVDFELNSIPRATVRLPLGRQVPSNAASAIHGLVQSLTEQVPIQVYCQVAATSTSDRSVRGLGLPTGAFLCFDGYAAGGGYARNNQGAAQYAIACNHWLTRLNQGSAFSASSHPGNPARYSYGALMPSAADTGALNWTAITGASDVITQGNLATDAWGSAFHPWFRRLASSDGFWATEVNLKGDGTNKPALLALDRMKPGLKYGVAAQLRSTLSIDVDVAAEIAADVVKLTSDPTFAANQTLWDILVANLAPDYLLAVVPRVASALVVPYIPGNRGTAGAAYAKILAQEYVGIQVDAAMRRPLRAYGILSSLATRDGATMDDTPEDASTGIGGWYDTKKDGTVMIQPGPRWMNAILSPSRYVDAASGGDLKAIGNAQFPGAGAAGDAGAQAKDRAKNTIKPLLDAYAKARYAQEVLQGRQAVITGAFRLDIAPGSLVEIEGASEQFIADLDQFGLGYFGEVLRVSLSVDAETPAVGTAFHVGNVRSAAENADDKTSVDGHPLYEATFQGCPLVDPA